MIIDLFSSVASVVGLAPKPLAFSVPSALPNFRARTAADLVSKASLAVSPGSPNPATQTPVEFLSHKLNSEQDMLGATQAIAHGLPQKQGLQWATDSARLVEDKLPPAQKAALAAAQAFQASPSVATREAAALAAADAGSHGPGGLAAKAASFADVPGAPAKPGADKLVPICVAGAVALAVSLSPRSAPKLPETPSAPKLDIPLRSLAVQPPAPAPVRPGSPAAVKNASAFKPFIERGLALAAG